MALLRRCRHCRVLVFHQLVRKRGGPLQETTRTISLRPLRSLSSWRATSSIPWLSYQQESPVDLELLRKKDSLRRKWERLEKSLHNVVRQYFHDTAFPKEFAITSREELWSPATSPSGSLSKTSSSSSPSRPSPSTTLKQKPSHAGEVLLALNAFESVLLPKPKDVLDLAEGVIITPAPPKDIKGYTLYVQSAEKKENEDENRGHRSKVSKSNKENKKPRDYPVFMEEDFTLYRLVENQAAIFLDHQYNTFTRFFDVYIDEPSKRIAARIESSGLYNLLLDQPTPSPSKSIKATLNGNDDKANDIRHINPSVNLKLGEEPLQNLLVMSYEDNELTFYEHMTPSTRIAALPNVMGHNSASTLVHVSLVIFGALPLAYRSYVFALNYPGFAQSIAASVALTITYGIWSHRTSARTNQSRVVANALLHRVHARDDAVVYVLQEGAIRKTTRAILHEYYQQTFKYGHKDSTLIDETSFLANYPTLSSEQTDLINPKELAVKLGLLETKETQDGNENHLVPVPLDVALSSLNLSS